MRILLLEDEAAIRQALARVLGRWGHEVLAASCVAEAHKLLADDAPQALVSDCKLPDGSGLKFAIESGLSFTLMSGMALFDDAVRAMRAGCVDFLTKPVKFDTLRHAVDRMEAMAEQSRSGSDSLLLPDTDSGSCSRTLQQLSIADGRLLQLDVRAWSLSWQDLAQAEQLFADTEFTDLTNENDGRSAAVIAELMQTSPQGRLVINEQDGRWRAVLEAQVDWQANRVLQDRKRWLDELSDRLITSVDAVQVEWHNA